MPKRANTASARISGAKPPETVVKPPSVESPMVQAVAKIIATTQGRTPARKALTPAYFIRLCSAAAVNRIMTKEGSTTPPMHDVWEVLDEDLKTSEIAYPSEEDAAREKVFTALSDEVNSELDLKWSEMKSYDEGGGSYLFLLLLLAMLALACFNIWRKVRRKTRNQY